jgi:hypothetical protein
MIDRGLVAALEVGQLLQDLGLFHAGQRIHAGALDGIAVGAVTVGAGGGQVAGQIGVGGLRAGWLPASRLQAATGRTVSSGHLLLLSIVCHIAGLLHLSCISGAGQRI